MRVIAALCIVAYTLLPMGVSGQNRTYQKGVLRAGPSWTATELGMVNANTSFQLLQQNCENEFYSVKVGVQGLGNPRTGWLHGYVVGMKIAPCQEVNLEITKPRSSSSAPAEGAVDENLSEIKGNGSGAAPILFRQSKSESPIGVAAVLSLDGADCTKDVTQASDEAIIVEQELLGLYDIVDRTHLEMILDEQRLALSGLVMEEGSLAKAGCLAGAQGTVVVTKGCLAKRDILTIKMLDCSSSMMYWVATGPPDQVYEIMAEVRSMIR